MDNSYVCLCLCASVFSVRFIHAVIKIKNTRTQTFMYNCVSERRQWVHFTLLWRSDDKYIRIRIYFRMCCRPHVCGSTILFMCTFFTFVPFDIWHAYVALLSRRTKQVALNGRLPHFSFIIFGDVFSEICLIFLPKKNHTSVLEFFFCIWFVVIIIIILIVNQ